MKGEKLMQGSRILDGLLTSIYAISEGEGSIQNSTNDL